MLNVEIARDCGSKYGGSVLVTDRIEEAVKDADVIYTDVWVSMGEESEFEERINLLKDYQVNKAMFELTGKDSTIFLHCLPAFHDTQTEYGQDIYMINMASVKWKLLMKSLEVSTLKYLIKPKIACTQLKLLWLLH